MSRSGYTEDLEPSDHAMWRGRVMSTLRSKRGQAFLREMLAALDGLPEAALIVDEIIDDDGDCCAIGAVAVARQMDVTDVDPECPDQVAKAFGIHRVMAQEIAYLNDEHVGPDETPSRRFTRMRNWVAGQIKESKP